MEKVVILARVSTDKQEYQRQINELTEYGHSLHKKQNHNTLIYSVLQHIINNKGLL
jgi:predicted site-specific integrase-resolvase